jgi:hypothetical protein
MGPIAQKSTGLKMACNQSVKSLNGTQCFYITKTANSRINVSVERPLKFKREVHKISFNIKDIEKN